MQSFCNFNIYSYITVYVTLCNKENIAKQIIHITYLYINDEAEIVDKDDKNDSDDKESGGSDDDDDDDVCDDDDYNDSE